MTARVRYASVAGESVVVVADVVAWLTESADERAAQQRVTAYQQGRIDALHDLAGALPKGAGLEVSP